VAVLVDELLAAAAAGAGLEAGVDDVDEDESDEVDVEAVDESFCAGAIVLVLSERESVR
jgi:hypothetical protein